MHQRPNWTIKFPAALTIALALAAACGTELGPPMNGPSPTAVGGSGGESASDGVCAPGEIRSCKVVLDDSNCFVGEQTCDGEGWGDCLDADNLDSLALGGSAPCQNNPCNPECQSFEETPSAPITATGSTPPAGGSIEGLPSAWKSKGQQEPCNGPEDCQFDTYCDTSTNLCEPWSALAPNDYDATATLPNFTLPVICDGDNISVCNRGGVDFTGDLNLVFTTADPGNFGNGTAPGNCNGFGPPSPSECIFNATIPKGECVSVTTCGPLNSTKTVYVNSQDQANPPPYAAEQHCGDNWTVYHNTSECSCVNEEAAATISPVTMYMTLDNSYSMTMSGIWSPAKSAVRKFITDPGSDNINFAMRMFEDGPVAGCSRPTCSAAACQQPVLQTAPNNAPNLLSNATYQNNLDAYVAAASGNVWGTPHKPVVAGMAAWGSAYRTGHPNDTIGLVYISDGSDLLTCAFNGSAASAQSIATPAYNAYINHDVLFYTVALPGASLLLLDEIAAQGGTGAAIDLTASPTNKVSAHLTDALQAIQGSLFTCSLDIPNAATVDFNDFGVDYWPTGTGTPSNMVTKVNNAAACSTASNARQYYFDNPTNPTQVILCPSLCTTVQGTAGSVINFTGGCAGGYTTHTFTQEYYGDCSSFGGERAQWDFLTYDTDVPGDASVVWETSTGNSLADAQAGPWTVVGTSTAAEPDATGGDPVSLKTILSPLHLQDYLVLRVTINPTSDGSATPMINDWKLQYSCVDLE